MDKSIAVDHNQYPGTMAEIVEITRDNPNYGRLVKEVLNA